MHKCRQSTHAQKAKQIFKKVFIAFSFLPEAACVGLYTDQGRGRWTIGNEESLLAAGLTATNSDDRILSLYTVPLVLALWGVSQVRLHLSAEKEAKTLWQGRQEKGIGPIFHRFRAASAETLVFAIEVWDQGKGARLGSDNLVSADQIGIKLNSFHLHNYSSGWGTFSLGRTSLFKDRLTSTLCVIQIV